ncbi:MAG: aldo/keto reductase [Christensenellaceae bacterium]
MKKNIIEVSKERECTGVKYRTLGKTGLQVSELSLGCEYVWHSDEHTVHSLVHAALDAGINYIDIFIGTPATRDYFGTALKGRHEQVMLAGHLGGAQKDGQYVNSRDIVVCKDFIEQFYTRLQTDVIDVLFLHNCDSEEDRKVMFEGPMYEYAKKLQAAGRVKFIGFSSHNTKVALTAVKSGLIDVLMFPINPLFNLLPRDRAHQKLFDINGEEEVSAEDLEHYPSKEELYAACRKHQIGLIGMKPFAAGNLLKSHKDGGLKGFLSLTPVQCISYILAHKEASSALPGFKNVEELNASLAYFTASEEEKDFSMIQQSVLYQFHDRCMYCNHCQPCPKKIDIAAVTECKDLAENGMTQALRERYRKLSANADDCIACGACTKRCPFGIDVVSNMRRAAELFR